MQRVLIERSFAYADRGAIGATRKFGLAIAAVACAGAEGGGAFCSRDDLTHCHFHALYYVFCVA
jgi:hypothetical protein